MSTTLDIIRLRPFVAAVLEDFEAAAGARNITLDALVFSDELEADASLLRRLLTGLVAGALLRAPTGTGVSLVVSPRNGCTEFRVADEGAGIKLETQQKVFDAAAGGLRLGGPGLTYCRLMAEANGGSVSVSETDNGTVVCLVLPNDPVSSASKPAAPDAGATSWVTNARTRLARSESGIFVRATETTARTRTILVVDDEPLIRTFVVRVLRSAGYDILEAGSAEHAVEIFNTRLQRLALLLTDVKLPGASGIDLVRRAKLLNPGLPTLLMSATPRTALARNEALSDGTYLLQKPFESELLLAKIAELLHPAHGAAGRVMGAKGG